MGEEDRDREGRARSGGIGVAVVLLYSGGWVLFCLRVGY